MRRSSFFSSLQHAWHGLRLGLRAERNFRIQVFVGGLVLFALIFFPVSHLERLLLLLLIMLVLVLELLNSSVERLVDLTKPRLDEYARDIKDLMAGAVLLTVVFTCLIGAVIFWPHFVFVFFRVTSLGV